MKWLPSGSTVVTSTLKLLIGNRTSDICLRKLLFWPAEFSFPKTLLSFCCGFCSFSLQSKLQSPPLTQHLAQLSKLSPSRAPSLRSSFHSYKSTTPCPKMIWATSIKISRWGQKKRLWPTRIKRLITDIIPPRNDLIKNTGFKDIFNFTTWARGTKWEKRQ